MKNLTTIGVTLGVLTIAVATFLWLGRGYGTVSPDAYQVAQALYSSCLAKSEVRLEAVESTINDAGDPPLEITAKEQRWLKAIIADAKAGNWQSAAAAARQMMEDQVEY